MGKYELKPSDTAKQITAKLGEKVMKENGIKKIYDSIEEFAKEHHGEDITKTPFQCSMANGQVVEFIPDFPIDEYVRAEKKRQEQQSKEKPVTITVNGKVTEIKDYLSVIQFGKAIFILDFREGIKDELSAAISKIHKLGIKAEVEYNAPKLNS